MLAHCDGLTREQLGEQKDQQPKRSSGTGTLQTKIKATRKNKTRQSAIRAPEPYERGTEWRKAHFLSWWGQEKVQTLHLPLKWSKPNTFQVHEPGREKEKSGAKTEQTGEGAESREERSEEEQEQSAKGRSAAQCSEAKAWELCGRSRAQMPIHFHGEKRASRFGLVEFKGEPFQKWDKKRGRHVQKR